MSALAPLLVLGQAKTYSQQVACLLAFKQTVQITTQVDSKYISKVKNPTHRGEAMHAQSG